MNSFESFLNKYLDEGTSVTNFNNSIYWLVLASSGQKFVTVDRIFEPVRAYPMVLIPMLIETVEEATESSVVARAYHSDQSRTISLSPSSIQQL